MGEAKNKSRHLPPPGMENHSGKLVAGAARDVMAALDPYMESGMSGDVLASILVTCGVDLWRANYGDARCGAPLKATIERRLQHPSEYWGVGPKK